MKRVLILYKFLPQYRVDFFNLLRSELANHGIELTLVYSKSLNANALRNDEVDLEWAQYVPSRRWQIGNSELLWQPCLPYLKNKDLVIVEQANKLLINYYLMMARYVSSFRFAFWGHGRNRQGDPGHWKEKFKSLFLKQCDWWFAYTREVKDMLVSQGYPENQITVVQNAFDTISLQKFYHDVAPSETDALRKEFGIEGDRVGIYCGALYADKRIDFILEACHAIRDRVEDFHMIFLGAGNEARKVQEATRKHPWIHYVGPKFGTDRAKYFKLAALQVMPSCVGLGILDSFAMETPIVTTDEPRHGPEIGYLEPGVNGLITPNHFDDYVQALSQALLTGQYQKLTSACRDSAQVYTVEQMVQNFTQGILKCLDS
jgi:glycosyltransferase involved in cell wall biosynthesis